MLYLILFPVIYAALAYRPAAVAVCGISALAQVAVIGATDAHITPHADTLMIVAVIGGMSVLAVAASVFRGSFNEQALLLRELAALADTDGLTGCLNHRVPRAPRESRSTCDSLPPAAQPDRRRRG